MLSTMVLLLGSLTTGQDSNPFIACNKQGTAYDSVWIRGTAASAKVLYERNGTGDPIDVPTYPNSGPLSQPATGLACTVDVDDSAAINNAIVWTAHDNTLNQSMAYCSVNLKSPFRVGYNSATNQWLVGYVACVSLMRQPLESGNIVVAVSFMANLPGNILYSQVFVVNPATGAVVSPLNPVVLNKTPGGTLYLGGSSGDDTGDFVVTYSRWQYQEGSPMTTGVFVTGFNYANLPTLTFHEVTVQSTGQSTIDYVDSRVACYHDGGFVVAWNDPYNAMTTIYTMQYTAAAGTLGGVDLDTYVLPSQSEAMEYWDFRVAVPRNVPGDYIVTFGTELPYGEGGGSYGVINVVYYWISGGGASGLTFVTENTGYTSGISDVPVVALSDMSNGIVYWQIDDLNEIDVSTIQSPPYTGTLP